MSPLKICLILPLSPVWRLSPTSEPVLKYGTGTRLVSQMYK